MELVADTNILFSFFWTNSLTKKLLSSSKLLLYSPTFALEEINFHKEEIMKKAQISEKAFKDLRFELATSVVFEDISSYKGFLKRALETSPDPHDVDFFALALAKGIPLWSNDRLLKTQRTVLVLSTKELLFKLSFNAEELF